jgi:hypothetical protein
MPIVEQLVRALGTERVMFEAADPEVFAWYIKKENCKLQRLNAPIRPSASPPKWPQIQEKPAIGTQSYSKRLAVRLS